MKKSDELRRQRDDLLREAEQINQRAEGRDLTPAEQADWDRIMRVVRNADGKIDLVRSGQIANLDAAIETAIEQEAATRSRRQDMLNASTNYSTPELNRNGDGPYTGPEQKTLPQAGGRAPLMLRNKATGQLVRALEPHERTPREVEASCDIGDVLASIALGRDIGTARGGGLQNAVMASAGNAYFVKPGFSEEVVDLARSATVCFRAGARQAMMDTATMELVVVRQDPTAVWRQPGVAITASHGDYGALTLRSHTLAAAVPIDVESFEDAANLGEVLRMQLAAALGLALDQAAMLGDAGGATPVGIRATTGVNSVPSVGAPDDYADVTSAVQKIYEANYPGDPDGLSWILHPRDAATYDGLTSSADAQPLMPTPWAGALRKFMTTSLPTDEGGGGNESIMLVGDFSQLLFGMRTEGLRIEVLREGQITDSDSVVHNATSELKVILRAYLRADVAVLRPTWFSLLSGITTG